MNMTKYDLGTIAKAAQQVATAMEELVVVSEKTSNYALATDIAYTVRMLKHIQESLTEIAGAYPVQE